MYVCFLCVCFNGSERPGWWRISAADGSMVGDRDRGRPVLRGPAGDISCCSSPADRQLGSAIPAGHSLWQQLPRWQHVSTALQHRWGREGEQAGSPMHHQLWWVCQYCLDPGGAGPAVTHTGPLQRASTHTQAHTKHTYKQAHAYTLRKDAPTNFLIVAWINPNPEPAWAWFGPNIQERDEKWDASRRDTYTDLFLTSRMKL